MPHRCPVFDVMFCTLTCKRADPGDIARALGHADRPAGIEQIEDMRRLDAEVVGRQRQPLVGLREQPLAFAFND